MINFAKAFLVALGAASLLTAAPLTSAASLVENFDTIPAGWTITNNTNPDGPATWFQGQPNTFPAQSGEPSSYLGASFLAGNPFLPPTTISLWLITPTLTFHNGDVVSFYTRSYADSPNPDRLQLRFSAAGGTDVGSTADSVGTFTSLLLDINPELRYGGYPELWTKQVVTISGLDGGTEGSLAFRYYIPISTLDGVQNGNVIGIDTFSITAAVPEPSSLLMVAAGLGVLLTRRRWARPAANPQLD